ncbi:MAG: dephospho-CoA kinase [Bacillota bacterium]|nr:dephospho-CoA kinase [Bacillota bacterium]
MKLIGLTGDAGSGKSTVARLLAELGAAVIDADRLARAVVAPGSPGLAAVAARFGPSYLTPGGELDRAQLGDLVFNDPEAHRVLDEILLPPITRAIEDEIARLERESTDVAVLDAPRLLEARLDRLVDEVWVVTADEPVKVARLAARGVPADRARRILANQIPQAEKVRHAHRVIDNNGSLTDLRAQVIKAWTAFHPG